MQGFAALVGILIWTSSPSSAVKKDFKRENKTRRHETTPWSPLDMVHPFMKSQPDPGYTQFAQDVIDGRTTQQEHYSFEDDQSVFDDSGLKGVMKQLKSQKMGGEKPAENSDSAEPPAAYAAEIAAYLSPGIGDPPSDMPSGSAVMLNEAAKSSNGNHNGNMMLSNNLLGRMSLSGPVGLPLNEGAGGKSSKYLGGSPTEGNFMQLPKPNLIQQFHKPSPMTQTGMLSRPGVPPDVSVVSPGSMTSSFTSSQGGIPTQEGMTTQGIMATQAGPMSGGPLRGDGTLAKQMGSPLAENAQEMGEEKANQEGRGNQLMGAGSSGLLGSSNQLPEHIQQQEQEADPQQQAMSLKPQESPLDVDVPSATEAAGNQMGPSPLGEGDTTSGASRQQVTSGNGVMGEMKKEGEKGDDLKGPGLGVDGSAMLLKPKKTATVTGSTRQKGNSTNINSEKTPANIRQQLKDSLLGSALESYTDSLLDSKNKLNTLAKAKNTSQDDTAPTATSTEEPNPTKPSDPPKAKHSDGKKKNILEGNLMKLDKKKIVSILAKLMRKYKKNTLPKNETKETKEDYEGITDELSKGINSNKDVSSLEDELQRQGMKRSLVEQIKRFILSKATNTSMRDPYADIGSISGASTSSKKSKEENAETRHSVHINLFDDKSNKEKNKCAKKKEKNGVASSLLGKRHSVHVNLFDKGSDCDAAENKEKNKEQSTIQSELTKLKDMVRQVEKTRGAINALSEDKNKLEKESSGDGAAGSATFANESVALMKDEEAGDGKNRYVKESELDQKVAETMKELIKDDRTKDADRNISQVSDEKEEEEKEKEKSIKTKKNKKPKQSISKNDKEKENVEKEEEEAAIEKESGKGERKIKNKNEKEKENVEKEEEEADIEKVTGKGERKIKNKNEKEKENVEKEEEEVDIEKVTGKGERKIKNKNKKEKENVEKEEEEAAIEKETGKGERKIKNKNEKESAIDPENQDITEEKAPIVIPDMKIEKKPKGNVKGFTKEEYPKNNEEKIGEISKDDEAKEKEPKEKVKGSPKEDSKQNEENMSQISRDEKTKENSGSNIEQIKIPSTNFNVHDVKQMLRKIQKEEESKGMLKGKKFLSDSESKTSEAQLVKDSSSKVEMTTNKSGDRNTTLITVKPGRKLNSAKPENVVVQFNVTPMQENKTDPKPSKSGAGMKNKYQVQSVENKEDKSDKTLERKLIKNDSKKKEDGDLDDDNRIKTALSEATKDLKVGTNKLDPKQRNQFESGSQGDKNSHKDNIAIVDKMIVVDSGALSVPESEIKAVEESSTNALAKLADSKHMAPQSLAGSPSSYMGNDMSGSSGHGPQKEQLNGKLSATPLPHKAHHKPPAVREELQPEPNDDGKDGDPFMHEILTSEGLKGLEAEAKEEPPNEGKEEPPNEEKEEPPTEAKEEPPTEAKEEPPTEAKEAPTEAKEFGESSVEHYGKGVPENMDRKVERLFAPAETSNGQSSEGVSQGSHSSGPSENNGRAGMVEDEQKGNEGKLPNDKKLKEFGAKEAKNDETDNESKSANEEDSMEAGRMPQTEGKEGVQESKVQQEEQEDQNKSKQGNFSNDSSNSKSKEEDQSEGGSDSSENDETKKEGSHVEKLKEELKEKQSQLENLKEQLKQKLREKLTTKFLKLKNEANKLENEDQQANGKGSNNNNAKTGGNAANNDGKVSANENNSQTQSGSPTAQSVNTGDGSYSSNQQQQQNGKVSKMIKTTDKDGNEDHNDRKIETESHSSTDDKASTVNYGESVNPSSDAVADRKAKQEKTKDSGDSKDSGASKDSEDSSEDGGMTVNILSAHDAPNVYKLMDHMKQNKKEHERHQTFEKLTSTR